MNIQECDILRILYTESYINQRQLAEASRYSLGVVNKSLKSLAEKGYLDEEMRLTAKAKDEIRARKPENAIILAAGFGMRMVPINAMTPKGLLKVKGEPLVERIIRQLHEVGIRDIVIVVGFMKERYDYLIDKYGVDLVVNTEYASKNNLASLALVTDRISNTYIIPCDIWAESNPFSFVELYSWYMVTDSFDKESDVRVNRRKELVRVSANTEGNAMIGISYLQGDDSKRVIQKIKELKSDIEHDEDFWENALYNDEKMTIAANIVRSSSIVEINTYEQLRRLDGDSDHLKSEALDMISEVLDCAMTDIVDITVLKKGMTNRSFLFTVADQKYIMRIPGEGTEVLIDREKEAETFRTISGLGFCDDPLYIDPKTGYKITRFLKGVHVCDPGNEEDLKKCMKLLKKFHLMRLKVDHVFDIYEQIEFYEKLWDGIPSAYGDYEMTKKNVLSLKVFIEEQPKDWCLTHIDAVPDNFLFYNTVHGEDLQLTDWEYAGMQDPHVDLAMFSIYSYYNREQIDHLMYIYFGSEPDQSIKAKIYCYVAACGLLWSNWTEYKSTLGVEFGEYGLRQYRYAKEFYKYAKIEMGEK